MGARLMPATRRKTWRNAGDERERARNSLALPGDGKERGDDSIDKDKVEKQ